MELGVLFFVVSDVKDYLVSKGHLLTDGKFTSINLLEDVEIAKVVENSLKAHGVTVQGQVDKVINALPLIISLVG